MTRIIKQSGPVMLEQTKEREFCVTSVEKGATVYSYFTDEIEAFEHYLKKVQSCGR